MNGKEVAEVVALCQEKFTAMAGKWPEFTIDAWEKELLPYPRWLGMAAVYEIAKWRRYVSESDIHTAIATMRRVARANVRRLRPLDEDSLPYDPADCQAARNAHENHVKAAADDLIQAGAVDFTGFDVTTDDGESAPELKVAADRLAQILPPAPRRQLPPADPGRRQWILNAATPRPEARPPKVEREPVDQLTDAEMAERAAEQQRQKDALQKLIADTAPDPREGAA